jgi:hypothetical protein
LHTVPKSAVQQTNDRLLHGPAALCSGACYPSSSLAAPGAGPQMSSLSGSPNHQQQHLVQQTQQCPQTQADPEHCCSVQAST